MTTDLSAAELAEAVVGPLARIHLAASELARRAETPGSRALAEGVVRDVLALDRATSGIVARPEGASVAAEEADLRPLFLALYDRLGPALRPRGLTWLEPDLPGRPVPGDAAAVRRVATALVRGVAEGAVAEAALRLSVTTEESALGVVVEVERDDGSSCAAAIGAQLASISRLPLVSGTELEQEASIVRATAWLRGSHSR